MGYRKNRGNNAGNNYGNSSNSNVAGASNTGNGNSNVAGAFNNDNDVETVFSPTENVQNVRTNRRTVRRVHPTHIENITRDMYRVENYYPTTASNKHETYVQEYDCGSDLNNPCCKPVKKCNR